MELNNVKEACAAEPTAPVTTVDVLISGAGPTGLALGIDLARRGVRALIAERQPTLSPGARGTGLQPRTQEVYDDLGVLPAVQAAGGRYPRLALWEDGRIARTRQMVESVEPTPGSPYSNALMIPQWRNVELLHERLSELGGGVRFGTELAHFEQDADGVTARLGLAGGGSHTVRARYLVAADGGRSTVRKGLGIGMSGPQLAPGAGVLADLRVDGLDRDHWHRWMLPDGRFVMLLPLAGTDHFQSFTVATTDEPDISPDGVRALIARWTHLAPEQLGEVLWASVYRPRAGLAHRYRCDRIFLAGDAAHIHSPAGGQGLNTSVQDAYNLGWKLGQVLHHGAPDALLDTYESERRPIAAGILETSTRLHRSGSLVRGRDLHQLGIGYPDSPLSTELRPAVAEGARTAGDRAPDAPCRTADGRTTRLFDVYRGPHFTLLTLGDTDLDETALPVGKGRLRTVRVDGPDPDLTDEDGHIRNAYGDGPGVFLIRPDGYVAAAAPAHGATAHVTAALAPYRAGAAAGAAAR